MIWFECVELYIAQLCKAGLLLIFMKGLIEGTAESARYSCVHYWQHDRNVVQMHLIELFRHVGMRLNAL